MKMKVECNVARDLMPLALDSAASEESRRLLDEHLEDCAACREYYAGMRAALPPARAGDGEQEQKAFDDAARKLRKKRRFRLWRNILIGGLIGMVIAVGALWGWARLTQDLTTPVYHGNYNVFLSQLSDGRISFNMDYQGSARYMAVCVDKQEENGAQILYVYNETTRIPQYLRKPNTNYSFMRMPAEEMHRIAEIREGVPGEYVIVWQAGQSIPAASQEMEAYFAINDQIQAIHFKDGDGGKMYALSYEDSQRLEALSAQAAQAITAVPEWQ